MAAIASRSSFCCGSSSFFLSARSLSRRLRLASAFFLSSSVALSVEAVPLAAASPAGLSSSQATGAVASAGVAAAVAAGAVAAAAGSVAGEGEGEGAGAGAGAAVLARQRAGRLQIRGLVAGLHRGAWPAVVADLVRQLSAVRLRLSSNALSAPAVSWWLHRLDTTCLGRYPDDAVFPPGPMSLRLVRSNPSRWLRASLSTGDKRSRFATSVRDRTWHCRL